MTEGRDEDNVGKGRVIYCWGKKEKDTDFYNLNGETWVRWMF